MTAVPTAATPRYNIKIRKCGRSLILSHIPEHNVNSRAMLCQQFFKAEYNNNMLFKDVGAKPALIYAQSFLRVMLMTHVLDNT